MAYIEDVLRGGGYYGAVFDRLLREHFYQLENLEEGGVSAVLCKLGYRTA
jgi:hypothetical protein